MSTTPCNTTLSPTDTGVADIFKLSRPVSALLERRYTSAGDIGRFLNTPLSELSDPFLMPAMSQAIDRLVLALQRHENVAVHGDYDADGVTSSVLLNWMLCAYGIRSDVFISNRLDDGYGPTPDTIRRLCEQGKTLIITTDCGITSFDAAETARDLGVDLIITDHHSCARSLPKALCIVNPRMYPDLKDLHAIAGVGVVFKICHALQIRTRSLGIPDPVDLREGLDLVAIGTIADSCPLTGENRIFVKNGLRLLNARPRPGLQALSRLSRIQGRLNVTDISRRIAPKINAAGRVGDPMVSARILASSSIEEAHAHAATLEAYNQQRRETERRALPEVMDLAKAQMQLSPPPKALLLIGEGWHPGIVGLLATKVCKQYQLPTIILSRDKDGDDYLGSGRAPQGASLLAVLRECEDLLASFGGHPLAVGLSLRSDKLEAFKTAFHSNFTRLSAIYQTGAPAVKTDDIGHEGELELNDLSPELFRDLELLEPFGPGNPEPAFTFKAASLTEIRRLNEEIVRGIMIDGHGRNIEFIAYDMEPEAFIGLPPVTLIASPRIRIHHNGSPAPQLLVHRIVP